MNLHFVSTCFKRTACFTDLFLKLSFLCLIFVPAIFYHCLLLFIHIDLQRASTEDYNENVVMGVRETVLFFKNTLLNSKDCRLFVLGFGANQCDCIIRFQTSLCYDLCTRNLKNRKLYFWNSYEKKYVSSELC